GLVAAPVKIGKSASGIAELFSSSKSTARQIAKGLQENELPFQVAKEPKTSNLFTFEQGTEGRSITPSTKPESIFRVTREPSGKVSAGFSKVPPEIKIPKSQGEAENPLAFIETTKAGPTAIVRKETI